MPLSDSDIHSITQAVISQLKGKGAEPMPQTPPPLEPIRVDLPSIPVDPGNHRHPVDPAPEGEGSRVIVAAFGRNRPGVAAALTGVMGESGCDIADITQKILQEFFSMIMIIDMAQASVDFQTLRQKLNEIESRLGVTIVAQHEDVFRAMHRI